MTAKKRSASRRRPHAQLHLPVLTAEQARLLIHVLERAIDSLYRAHGDAIAELCAARIDPPPHPTVPLSGSVPDDDFPF